MGIFFRKRKTTFLKAGVITYTENLCGTNVTKVLKVLSRRTEQISVTGINFR
jgi:hypothetical protein